MSYKFNQSVRLSEWEKNLNKIWKKLSVGQEITIYKAIHGEEMTKWWYHPTSHISNLDKNGKKMFNDKGQLLQRTWKTIDKKGISGISNKRETYDYLIKKYNVPVLDRKIGTGIYKEKKK